MKGDEKDIGFIGYLREGASRLGFPLDAELIRRLGTHWDALCRWSAKMNLTALRRPRDAAEKLYLESILAARLLDEKGTVYDVGSGGGFPGLVIKAVYPSREVVLVEARAKKVSFLRHVARQMNVTQGLTIIHGRAGWDNLEIKAQELFSRATFPPKTWIPLASRLIQPGGRFWLFSCFSGAEENDAEIDVERILRILPKDFFLEKVHRYRLPFCGAERQLLAFRGREPQEKKFLATPPEVC